MRTIDTPGGSKERLLSKFLVAWHCSGRFAARSFSFCNQKTQGGQKEAGGIGNGPVGRGRVRTPLVEALVSPSLCSGNPRRGGGSPTHPIHHGARGLGCLQKKSISHKFSSASHQKTQASGPGPPALRQGVEKQPGFTSAFFFCCSVQKKTPSQGVGSDSPPLKKAPPRRTSLRGRPSPRPHRRPLAPPHVCVREGQECTPPPERPGRAERGGLVGGSPPPTTAPAQRKLRRRKTLT